MEINFLNGFLIGIVAGIAVSIFILALAKTAGESERIAEEMRMKENANG